MNLGVNFEQWLYSPEVFNDIYSSSDDDDMSDGKIADEELETIRAARIFGQRSTDAC